MQVCVHVHVREDLRDKKARLWEDFTSMSDKDDVEAVTGHSGMDEKTISLAEGVHVLQTAGAQMIIPDRLKSSHAFKLDRGHITTLFQLQSAAGSSSSSWMSVAKVVAADIRGPLKLIKLRKDGPPHIWPAQHPAANAGNGGFRGARNPKVDNDPNKLHILPGHQFSINSCLMARLKATKMLINRW